MLKGILATLGLVMALALGACEEAGDGQVPPPQEPAGTTPPATQ